MGEFLFQYHQVKPTTWVYLSSLLMIGLYFKFNRLWSVRNLDLLLLILLAPGMLLVHFGKLARQGDALADEAVVAVQAERPTDQVSPDGAVTNPVGGVDRLAGGATASGSSLTDENSAGTGASGSNTDGPAGALESAGAEAVSGEVAPEVVAPDALVAEAERGDWPATTPLPERAARVEGMGFLWLFVVGFLVMVRLLIDPAMVRRPLLEPNLSAGGLIFMACSLFVFLMANVISDTPGSPRVAITYGSITGAPAPAMLNRVGYGMLWMVPPGAAKLIVIFSHLAIVIGLVIVGFRHFGNTLMGIGAATMYLMLPYTSLLTGRIDHVLPAAFLIWGVVCYRRPLLAGVFTAVAGGLVFYPLFLFPLWASFYWQRGLVRYVIGWVTTLIGMTIGLLMVSSDPQLSLRLMYGLVSPSTEWVTGAWDSRVMGWDSVYRWPVLAAYLVLALSMALWPAQKNLGTLLSCSAALMVGAQFWHAHDGGIYMAWYLPLVLLTIFRPNLEDRVALSVLGDRRSRSRSTTPTVDLAAFVGWPSR